MSTLQHELSAPSTHAAALHGQLEYGRRHSTLPSAVEKYSQCIHQQHHTGTRTLPVSSAGKSGTLSTCCSIHAAQPHSEVQDTQAPSAEPAAILAEHPHAIVQESQAALSATCLEICSIRHCSSLEEAESSVVCLRSAGNASPLLLTLQETAVQGFGMQHSPMQLCRKHGQEC